MTPPPFCYETRYFPVWWERWRLSDPEKSLKHSLNEARHQNGVLTHCFISRFRYFYHHSIVITSSYRCQVPFIQVDDTMLRLSAMGLVRIQKFYRDWKKGFSPPTPTTILMYPISPQRLLCILKSWLSYFFWTSSWFVYAALHFQI